MQSPLILCENLISQCGDVQCIQYGNKLVYLHFPPRQHDYVGPTQAQQCCLHRANVGKLCWPNVILLIGSTLGQRVGPTLAQLGGPTLVQRIDLTMAHHVGPILAQHVGPTLTQHVVITLAQHTKPQWSTIANNVGPTLVQHKGHCNFLINFTDPLW